MLADKNTYRRWYGPYFVPSLPAPPPSRLSDTSLNSISLSRSQHVGDSFRHQAIRLDDRLPSRGYSHPNGTVCAIACLTPGVTFLLPLPQASSTDCVPPCRHRRGSEGARRALRPWKSRWGEVVGWWHLVAPVERRLSDVLNLNPVGSRAFVVPVT